MATKTVNKMKNSKITTLNGAKGGGQCNVGKQTVKAAKPA